MDDSTYLNTDYNEVTVTLPIEAFEKLSLVTLILATSFNCHYNAIFLLSSQLHYA